MSKPLVNPNIKEYENQQDLAEKADRVFRTIVEIVEKELGGETEGVTFMPCLSVICKLQNDPTSNSDPVAYSLIKRPSTPAQIDSIVHHLLLKDNAFLSSIMHGIATNLTEMFGIHHDMSAMIGSMVVPNEENEVESKENSPENTRSEKEADVEGQGTKKVNFEVN